jgi:murein DD-endopeptidase MepM/ murein hydrolase activator NlpD
MYFNRNIIILISIVIISISCKNTPGDTAGTLQTESDSSASKAVRVPNLLYGINTDSFDQVTGHIKQNVFLSDILRKHGISMNEIDKLLKNSKSVFDVRKLRSGNDYILLCDRVSMARARYLVYKHDPTSFYIFSFNDSLNITLYRKAIRSEIRYASGTIETSMWDAMIGGGLAPSLANDLSDIFAWTVDFFGLQKGDKFRVIYEEFLIDDKRLTTGRIYAAQFSRSGSTVTAIPFIQNDKESYFDVDGKSLKKAFLKAPLQFSRISSHFSAARMHPILRIVRPHYGVDYAAPVGTPVHAIGDGRVISATDEGGAGKMVKIQHNSVYATGYLHLSRFGEGVSAGKFVKQNDIIGYVGTSGLSTGPHLDFRFYMNGSPVDPLKVDAPPVEPVTEENRERFEKVRSVVQSLLETIN